MQLCPLRNNIRRMSAGRFRICNLVCPDAAAECDCVRPDTFAYAVVSAVQNRPCSKLNALDRRNTIAIILQEKESYIGLVKTIKFIHINGRPLVDDV